MSLSPQQLYFQPVRPVVTIRDKLGDPTYLFHDSFNPPTIGSGSPLVYYVEANLVFGGAGTFTIGIDDHDRAIDETKIKMGNEVFIDVGRTSTGLTRLFSGIIKGRRKLRQGYGLLRYIYTGFGSQIIFNERIVNFVRSALPRPNDPTRPFYDDQSMQLYKLVKELCEQTHPIPLGWPTIKHTNRDNFLDTTSGLISTDANQFVPRVFEPYVEATQAINSMVGVSGAIWGVDEYNRVYLRYPTTRHSGIVIKNRPDSVTEFTDPNMNVAYTMSSTGFGYEDSTRKEDGFFNRIFSKTGTITKTSGSESNDQLTFLIERDIAQRFTVTSTLLRDLMVTVTLNAEPDSGFIGISRGPKVRILDDQDGSPGPNVELETRVGVPTDTGRPIAVPVPFPRDFRLKYIKPGDKAWIMMQQSCRLGFSATTGLVTVRDENNAYAWHHDGGTGGVSAVRNVFNAIDPDRPTQPSERTPEGDDTTAGWIVNNDGPTYSHVITDQFSHLIEASDQDSIDEHGLVETFIDANFITDAHTMNAFLASILLDAAKPRRIFEIPQVTIPYNTLFWPGQLVQIQDDVANLNIAAEIQEVIYRFSAEEQGRDPRGLQFCEIRPIAYVDFKDQYLTTPGQLGPLALLPQEGETDGGLAFPVLSQAGNINPPLQQYLNTEKVVISENQKDVD